MLERQQMPHCRHHYSLLYFLRLSLSLSLSLFSLSLSASVMECVRAFGQVVWKDYRVMNIENESI